MPGNGWSESTPADASRRSVYIFVKRSLVTPLLTAFDFPDVVRNVEEALGAIVHARILNLYGLDSDWSDEGGPTDPRMGF